MTKEELRNKAENLAKKEARNYKTVYSEDNRLKEVLNDLLRFEQNFPQILHLLMKEKHYRDGFSDGYITGVTDICKKILEEVENYNSSCTDIEEYGIYIEPLENIIKNLGVDIDD